nr:hypothetical protein [Tanacetum cinerariifolium]
HRKGHFARECRSLKDSRRTAEPQRRNVPEKLPDASQVLLRVPRDNNMYNVNLKNIVDGFTNSQNKNKDALVDAKDHDDDIQKSVSPDIHSSSSGAQTRKQG